MDEDVYYPIGNKSLDEVSCWYRKDLKVGMIVSIGGVYVGNQNDCKKYGTIMKIINSNRPFSTRFCVKLFTGREEEFTRSHNLLPCPKRYLTKDMSTMSQSDINTYEFFLAVGKKNLLEVTIY